MRSTVLVTLLLAAVGGTAHAGERCTPDADGGKTCEVGIPSDRVAPVTAAQQMSEWCWAASIATIFRYYGHPLEQAEIVRAIYGRVANLPAMTGDAMTTALSRPWVDDRGGSFQADVRVFDTSSGRSELDDQTVIDELRDERPLLVGTEGHAMVVTAMRYRVAPGGQPDVLGVTVRDPWPGQGRRDLRWDEMDPQYVAAVHIEGAPVPVPTSSAPAKEAPAMQAPAMQAPAMQAPAMKVPAMQAPAPMPEVAMRDDASCARGCASDAEQCADEVPSLSACIEEQVSGCVDRCEDAGYAPMYCQRAACAPEGARDMCLSGRQWALQACQGEHSACMAECD